MCLCINITIFACLYKKNYEEIQKIKPPGGGYKWVVTYTACPLGKLTRMAKTYVFPLFLL